MSPSQTFGSRRQVWNGTAKKTTGGLTKSDLVMSHGRIVSRAKHNSAKKEMRLVKYGYGTKKGKFGYVKLNGHNKGRKTRRHSRSRRSRKHRGGMLPLSPAEAAWEGYGISGAGTTDFGSQGSVGVQLEAGMSGGRRRRRGGAPAAITGGRRRHRGGAALAPAAITGGSGMRAMGSHGSANWNGEGISGAGLTDFGSMGSVGLQLEAGMSGGRRRRRGHRGGTTSRSGMGQGTAVFNGSPLSSALNAA